MTKLAAIVAGILVGAGPGMATEIPKVLVKKAPDGGIQPQAIRGEGGTIDLVYFKGEPAAGDLYYARWNADGKEVSAPIRVNSEARSAVAIGTIRGGQIASGKGGKVHVAWNGAMGAKPENPVRGAPMLYARLKDDRSGFEPQRNLMKHTFGLDGGGSVAADGRGNVAVVWHGRERGSAEGEGNRRVWRARSEDEGATFAAEEAIDDRPLGACGCCGAKAWEGPGGGLAILFRSASGGGLDRDMTLLTSARPDGPIRGLTLHKWRLGACPMSAASLSEGHPGVVAAWETAGQVYWARVDPESATASVPVAAPGEGKGRKHPAIAANSGGETLLAWDEGTGWGRGGVLAWQTVRPGRPAGRGSRQDRGRHPDLGPRDRRGEAGRRVPDRPLRDCPKRGQAPGLEHGFSGINRRTARSQSPFGTVSEKAGAWGRPLDPTSPPQPLPTRPSARKSANRRCGDRKGGVISATKRAPPPDNDTMRRSASAESRHERPGSGSTR